MHSLLRFTAAGGLLLTAAFFGTAPAEDFVDDVRPPDGVDIQLHGPIHEAFAQPCDLRPEPGLPVPKEPPPPIPEEPPAERPEGVNVEFIPGYWAWDAESNQFMWVTGTYRNVPTGRQWVPGNWVNTPEGWRWVPGFWAPENQPEMRYVPEPPAPLEVDPAVPAPDDISVWVPGNWMYNSARWAWRPGYWSPFRVGRCWIPARYVWTPYGFIFVDGYWDYPLDARGVLFAPVVFNRPYWVTPGWCWRPTYAVNFGLVFDSAFVRAGSFSFYFGNYYGSPFVRLGYQPWFTGYGRYDPAFSYYRWRNRFDDGWLVRQRQLYADRGAGRAIAPPRTLAQQTTILANKTIVNNTTNNFRVVAPLNQMKTINNNVNLVKLTPTQLETQKTLMQRTKDIAVVRSKQTAVAGATGTPRHTDAPAFKLPPLAKGTETIRSVEHPLPKPATTITPKAPVLNNPPKVSTPILPPKDVTPRVIEAPKTFKGPELPKVKINDPAPMPRNLDVKPAPLPKINTPPAPKSNNVETFHPKVIETPPRNVAPTIKSFDAPAAHRNLEFRVETPRHVEAPRVTTSPPVVHSPPAVNNPPPQSPSHNSTQKSNGKGNR